MSVVGVILVRIFPAFSRIWTECREIQSISPYLVQIRENARKMRTRITSNTESLYAVISFVQFVTLQGFRLRFSDNIEIKLKEMRLVLVLTLQI